jgi:glyoxylase I family protein
MRVHHIGISVKDLEKSSDFYKENLGFEEINRFTKPNWTGKAIILKNIDMQLEIFSFSDFEKKQDDFSNLKQIGIKHIGIQVDNVKEKYDELKSKNIDIDEPVKEQLVLGTVS